MHTRQPIVAIPRGLHGAGAGDPANRVAAEKPVQNIESDVPPCGAPRDEAAIDAMPELEPRAAGVRLELPAQVLRAPVVLKQAGRVMPLRAILSRIVSRVFCRCASVAIAVH